MIEPAHRVLELIEALAAAESKTARMTKIKNLMDEGI